MTSFLKDTRRFRRLNINIPVTFSVDSKVVKLRDKETLEGTIENISAGGVLIKTTTFVPKGLILNIDISTKDLIVDLPHPLTVETKIIHTQAKIISMKMTQHRDFKMGVQFLSLNPEHRKIINGFVEIKLKESEDVKS